MTYYDIVASPLGQLTIATDGMAITELHIAGDRYFVRVPVSWSRDPEHPLLAQARAELQDYFDGSRQQFEVVLGPIGTPFQQDVWTALMTIPYGSTLSYSELAQAVGRPQAIRAVGTAVGRNPICIMVPCHRVMARGGGLGGYVAGLDCKRQLLVQEGMIPDK